MISIQQLKKPAAAIGKKVGKYTKRRLILKKTKENKELCLNLIAQKT